MDKAFMPVQEQVTRSCNSCTITLYRGKFPYKLVWQRKPIFLLSLKKEIPQTHHVNLHRTAAGAPELYNSPWIMDPGFCSACHRLKREKKRKTYKLHSCSFNPAPVHRLFKNPELQCMKTA